MWRENLKGCTLYKSKPLEYKTKGTMYKRGLYTLQGIRRITRGLYTVTLLLVLIAVHDTWRIMMIKFSIDHSSIFVLR